MPGSKNVKTTRPTLTAPQQAFVEAALLESVEVRAAIQSAVLGKHALGASSGDPTVLNLTNDQVNQYQAVNNPGRYNLKTGEFFEHNTDTVPTSTGGPTLLPPY